MKATPKPAPLKIADTKNMAQNILKKYTSTPHMAATVFGLYGDLGSGKTTFMQFFGQALGIKEKISSPTFVIEKIYKIDYEHFDHLIHIDAYRIEHPHEMLTLGWEEIVKNPRNIICVEWADKIQSLMPVDHISIRFVHYDQESRVITVDDKAVEQDKTIVDR